MTPTKKPPPDSVGNVRGRMQALRVLARQRARMDEGEWEKALGRRLKEIEPQLAALRKRLAAVAASSEPVKVQSAPPPPEPEGDILATLGSL